jgi:N-methylhydantoinase B
MTINYNPTAVEIHRHALDNITREMALTLVRTSGTPSVTDAKDFCTCLLDVNAEQLSLSAYVLIHAATSLLGVRALVRQLAGRGQKPQPGDGWIVNDPHDGGAVHQADAGIITPLFHREDHVGWAFSNVHLLDVGGSGRAGLNPGAHTVFDEGIRFPVVQIIRDGRIEQPWVDFIAANVRVAPPVLSDIRSMIAANNVAERKLSQLIDRHGIDQHVRFCEINKDLSESLLRSRIEKLPDGIYTSRDWAEFDGHDGPDILLQLDAELEISASNLTFRFSGPPQVDSFMNSATGGMYGAVMTSLLTTLAYGDLPFNAGIWRPLTIDLGPKGTVVNAQPPAPVSATHAEVGLRACRVVKDLLSQAASLSADPSLRGRVAGQAVDGSPTVGVAGLNQFGDACLIYYQDTVVGVGGGAQSFMDGQDCYGMTNMAGCGMSDVESHEAVHPVLFLWREILTDSGGPGEYRGGQGLRQAYLIDKTRELSGWAKSVCAAVPPRGAGGGLPASASFVEPILGSDAKTLMSDGRQPRPGDINGDKPTLRVKHTPLVLHDGDVVQFRGGGGGGVGDPLLRDPKRVARDVCDGYISPASAADAYGVVLESNLEPDVNGTQQRRSDMRRDRIGANPTRPLQRSDDAGVSVTIGHQDGQDCWGCGHCGSDLGVARQNWYQGNVVVRETDGPDWAAQLGLSIRTRTQPPMMVVREYFCKSCAACLDVDVVPMGAATKVAPTLDSRWLEANSR